MPFRALLTCLSALLLCGSCAPPLFLRGGGGGGGGGTATERARPGCPGVERARPTRRAEPRSTPWAKRDEAAGDGGYLAGIRRLRRLYCNTGIGFHLQVRPDGKVAGVHAEDRYSLLAISPVERGVVTLFGINSGLFIAMSSRGKLYGSGHYSEECQFRESLLANNYNAYESAAHPGMFIGLGKTGKTKRGNRVSPAMTETHFLPRL